MSYHLNFLIDFDLFSKNNDKYFVSYFGEVYGWNLV